MDSPVQKSQDADRIHFGAWEGSYVEPGMDTSTQFMVFEPISSQSINQEIDVVYYINHTGGGIKYWKNCERITLYDCFTGRLEWNFMNWVYLKGRLRLLSNFFKEKEPRLLVSRSNYTFIK